VRAVKLIIEKKAADPDAVTTSLEQKVDSLVYKAFGLSAKDVAVIEGEQKIAATAPV
jgi:hypothetical protein